VKYLVIPITVALALSAGAPAFAQNAGKSARTPASREALLAGIAEALLFERALPTLLDPDAHVATVVISRIGAVNGDGIIAVTQIYAHHSEWFEAGAHADDNGEIGKMVIGRSSLPFDEWQRWWRARRDIAIVLRGLAVSRVVVAGASTNWAVESTVRDAHSHDLEVVVVRQAVITPFEDLHESSLRSMGSVFARVVDLDEALFDGELGDAPVSR
jgi:hypothetical protein